MTDETCSYCLKDGAEFVDCDGGAMCRDCAQPEPCAECACEEGK